MDILKYFFLYGGGLLAGIMNVIGGGGSTVTLPLLIFAGLPPNYANATNRLAILCQNAVGIYTFKKNDVDTFKESLIPGILTIIGSIAGTYLAIDLNTDVMKYVILAVLIFSVATIFFKKKIKISSSNKVGNFMKYPAFILVGVYGGLIQAGVGFILMSVITYFIGTSLIKTNSIKVTIVLMYTSVSFILFLINGMIYFNYGIILALGNMTGAYIAVKLSLKKGDKLIKTLLLIILAAYIINLLFFK